MKASASLSVVSVFLLCSSTVASQVCDDYAAMGRSFSVRLGYTKKPTDKLKWKFNDAVICFVKSTTEKPACNNNNYDINDDGSLKLIDPKKYQEGFYISEVHDINGKELHIKKTHLCIQDPVKKPKVEATCKEANVIFKCIPDKTSKNEIKKYEWLQNNAQTKKTGLAFTLTAAETKDIKFACNVSNEASFEVSDPVTHDCATSIPGIPGLPDELRGINICVFIGGGGVFVLLLTVTITECCVRVKRKRKKQLKNDVELPLKRIDTEQPTSSPSSSSS